MIERGQPIYEGLATTAAPHVGEDSFFELRPKDLRAPGQGDRDVFVPREPGTIGHSDEFVAEITKAIAGKDADNIRTAAQNTVSTDALAKVFTSLSDNKIGATLLMAHESQSDVSLVTGEIFVASKEMGTDILDHRFTSIYSKLLAFMGLKPEYLPLVKDMAEKHGGSISSGTVLDIVNNYSNTYLTLPDSDTVKNAGLDAGLVGKHQATLVRILVTDLTKGLLQADRVTRLHTLNAMCASATTDKLGVLSDGAPGLRIHLARSASRKTAVLGGRLIVPAVIHNPGDGTGDLRIGKPITIPRGRKNEYVHDVMDLIAHIKEELSGMPTEYDQRPRAGRAARVADLRELTML